MLYGSNFKKLQNLRYLYKNYIDMNVEDYIKKLIHEELDKLHGYEEFYHQTDIKSAKSILKNGFKTSEVWAALDDEGSYGDINIKIYAPKPKKPFYMDINELYDNDNNQLSYEQMQKLVEKNYKLYRDLGGETNPKTYNKLREMGYDTIIQDNGDRVFLYPQTLKYKIG